jgi:glycosyltransferase involved in cell wall biosynthesis
MVVDTGDSIYDLARSTGDRGRVALWLTKMLEYFAFWASHCVIVRSHPHQEVLARRGIIASVIPDGVDTDEFQLRPVGDLLRKHGFEGYTVLGLLGSIVWNPRWEMCYGWELVEVIDRLRDLPIKGLVIGDGSGLEHLKMWCAQRGIEDRVVFLGRVDYGTLPGYISLMDICLSTQTNDAAGQVRTTGKLPLYLSCGRFVLSTDVGEASRVLPPQMLLAYDGTKDLAYPRRLAERVRILIESPEQLHQMDESVAIAQTFFDYDVLAKKMSRAISATMRRHSEEREQGVESPLGK